jgi:hypothetical protein
MGKVAPNPRADIAQYPVIHPSPIAGSWARAHRLEKAGVAVLRRSVRGDPNGLPRDAFLIKNVWKNTAGGFC